MRLIINFFKILVIFGLVALLIIFFAGLINFLFLVISFDLVTWSFLDSPISFSEENLDKLEDKLDKLKVTESSVISSFLTIFGLASAWYIEWLFILYKKSLITKEIIVHQDSYLAYLDYLYEKFGYTREMVEKAHKIYTFYRDFFILVKDYLIHAWDDFHFFNFFFGDTWLDFFIWLIKWFFGPP